MATRPLTPKQEQFCREYLIDLNGTQAAIRAGYSGKTARSIGQRLLTNVDIQARIQELMKKREQRTEITADRVLQELARIAFSDPRKLFQTDGTLIPIPDLDDETAAVVAQLEVTEEWEGTGKDRKQTGITKKLKVWDKVSSLEKLGRHLGLFPSKIEHSGNLNLQHSTNAEELTDDQLAAYIQE